MIAPVPNWNPTSFLRFEKSIDSNMQAAKVVTDAGKAYIKAMGAGAGPHPLACELVGTQLAEWFELPTLDFAVMNLNKDDKVPFHKGGFATAGPAFVTRAIENAITWSGVAEELKVVENAEIITRLVVFDTWTLNWDRCPPKGDQRESNFDNILLTSEGASKGKWRMLPFDHTECFSYGRDLNDSIDNIERVKDIRIFGVFEPFRDYLELSNLESASMRLGEIDRDITQGFVDKIPPQWEVGVGIRNALVNLIVNRASFLADNVKDMLYPKYFNNLF